MREADWSALQRFALLQRLAPTGGKIEIGAIHVGSPPLAAADSPPALEAVLRDVLEGPAANDDVTPAVPADDPRGPSPPD
jgi:hypothetical protein